MMEVIIVLIIVTNRTVNESQNTQLRDFFVFASAPC